MEYEREVGCLRLPPQKKRREKRIKKAELKASLSNERNEQRLLDYRPTPSIVRSPFLGRSLQRIDLARIQHALQVPIHRLTHPQTPRSTVRPVTRVHSGKLVLARMTLDSEPNVRDHMTRDARPLHMRPRTVAPQATRRHLSPAEPVKECEVVGHARLVAFDPHATGGVGEVPEAFVDVHEFVGAGEGGCPGFFVDEEAVAWDDGAHGLLLLLLLLL